MKFRSLVWVGALAAASASLGADILAGNSCAAMAIPAANTYTLIAVPFKDVGGSASAVNVADVVKTAGLKAGSKLYYYDGTSYYAWNLASDGGAWAGCAVAKEIDGKSVTTVSPEGKQIPCGATLWLERAAGSDASVVVYGEEGEVASTTVVASTLQLVSNPKPIDHTVTEAGSDGDLIMIPSDNGTMDTYTYKTGKSGWCQYESTSVTVGSRTLNVKDFVVKTVKIPGGRGVWYASQGSTVPTFNW